MTITKKDLFMRRIVSIEGLTKDSEKVTLTFENGDYIEQYHHQDCCESVTVAQVDGNVEKHIGATILEIQEKVLGKDGLSDNQLPEYCESLTATFYTMKTSKGYLDWRWYGESNGYYSESVECELKTRNKNE